MKKQNDLSDTLFGDLTNEPTLHDSKMIQTEYERVSDKKRFLLCINCKENQTAVFKSADETETLSIEEITKHVYVIKFYLMEFDSISYVAKNHVDGTLSRVDKQGKVIRNPLFYEDQTAYWRGKRVTIEQNGVWDEQEKAYRMMWTNGCGFDSELKNSKR